MGFSFVSYLSRLSQAKSFCRTYGTCARTEPPARRRPPQKEQWCQDCCRLLVCCSHPSPLSQACVLHQSLSRRASLFYLYLEMISSSCAALSGLDARNARKQSSDELTSSYVALAGLSANMLEPSPVNEIIYLVSLCESEQGLITITIISSTSVASAWQGGPEKKSSLHRDF